jgi:hypothetical protein
MLDAVATQFPDAENVKSILSDLPVAKATNSYTRVVDGRLELAPGALGIRNLLINFAFGFGQFYEACEYDQFYLSR